MSGRRRFECTLEPRVDGSARVTRLVLLGDGLDVPAVLAQLHACCDAVAAAPLPGPGMPAYLLPAYPVPAGLAADLRFDVAPRTAAQPADVLLFRMTASRELCVPVRELRGRHGVDLDRVNRDLALAVNYTAGAAFVTALPGVAAGTGAADDDDDGSAAAGVHLRASLAGGRFEAAVWPALQQQADALMAAVFSHVQRCRCGF
jgi:hypothetical protein